MVPRSICHFIFMVILSQQGISGDEIQLDQSSAVIKRPGETVKISCKISGFTMTQHYMHWIRQKPGKALEWIGRVNSGSSSRSDYLIYADSVKNHFTMSEDVSQSIQYLEAKSLREEDTAVYYCARALYGAFDYWGKGTQVIVSSAALKPPTVSMMSTCNSTSDSQMVGCLASGFSPAESVSFKWMDQKGNALTDFIQYPTVTNGDKMLKVSHITINKAKLNQNHIMCTAVHPSKTVNETFIPVKTQSPTLSLVPVTTPKSTSVMCVIEDFYPKKLAVQWKVNDNSISQLKLESKLNEDTGLYTAYSFYKVSSETWNANNSYTCEVTHQGKSIIEKKNFKAKFTLTLKPPLERELFVLNKVVLQAVVSGDVKKTVEEASVSCTVNNVPVSNDIKPGNVFFDTSLFKRIHNVTIDTNKWFDGEMVTCTIHDKNNNRDIKQEIHFDKGDGQTPTVTIYRPEMITNTVSLVCEVTSQKLGNVYIMWKVGKESYIEGITSAPINKMDSTSVFSILTMSKDKYEDPNTTINCAVKHANMDNKESPLQVSTTKTEPPEPEKGFALNCNKDVLEEDEFTSLWSTATSFIFLFLFSLTYSAVLSLFKMKH